MSRRESAVLQKAQEDGYIFFFRAVQEDAKEGEEGRRVSRTRTCAAPTGVGGGGACLLLRLIFRCASAAAAIASSPSSNEKQEQKRL